MRDSDFSEPNAHTQASSVGRGQRAAARRAAFFWRISLLALGVLASSVPACGNGSVRSPFQSDGGNEAGAAGASEASEPDGGLDLGPGAADPTLGAPCVDDAQCEDQIACTADRCDDTVQRCRHVPDDTPCRDESYCNGEEVCDPRLGCRAGPPVACTDRDPCTIDTCVEKTESCTRTARDADGDGDAVWNCADGNDCDDADPTVSSRATEICANGKDDDCDGQKDEADCERPRYDTCDNALQLSASGSVMLSLAAAKLDYPTTCSPAARPVLLKQATQTLADVVLLLTVPEGAPRDIDIVAQATGTQVSLASAESCGVLAGERCSKSVETTSGSLSRLHLYSLAPGVYPLYVAGTAQEEVALTVAYSAASQPPTNEGCDQALPITAQASTRVPLIDASSDLPSECSHQTGELVYSFRLDQASDVRLFGKPLDDFGVPQISLRASCDRASAELTCASGVPNALVFARALPAGTYYVSVAASAPSDVDLKLDVREPTRAAADEGCAAPPELVPNQTEDILLADHPDAVNLGCLAGAPDASRTLTLSERSDVLLVERIAEGDTGAVSLAGPSCTKQTRLSCGTSQASPVRSRAVAIAPGSYRVVAESAAGNPVSLTAFTRPAAAEALVAFADDCSSPFEIPALGGRFRGNTANANPDFSAGCDVPNQAQFGASDQLLHLSLEQKSRVVLDMSGSKYATMLSVRRGLSCPGTELTLACAAGYAGQKSFLDLELESGNYYVQVDGYGGDAGAWVLDVYVTPDSD